VLVDDLAAAGFAMVTLAIAQRLLG